MDMYSAALADTAVRTHLQGNPETDRASFRDPVLYGEIHRVRQYLALAAAALADEGIGPDTARRLVARLAAETIGTDADRRRRAQELAYITSITGAAVPQAGSTGAATPQG